MLAKLGHDLLDNFIGEQAKGGQSISLFHQQVGHGLKKGGNG
jgi:hypothetical protein